MLFNFYYENLKNFEKLEVGVGVL